MIEKGYKRWGVDKTLFIKHTNYDIVVARIYIDNIVFGSTYGNCVQELDQIKKEFEMNMVDELTYFLGLQVKIIQR